MTAQSMVMIRNDSTEATPVGIRTSGATRVVSLDPGSEYGPLTRGLLTDMTRNLIARGTLSLRNA